MRLTVHDISKIKLSINFQEGGKKSFLVLLVFVFVLEVLSAQVELVVKNGEVPCNGSFNVELYVNNFAGLNNLTFTLEYDSDRVSYNGFQDLFPSGTTTTIPTPGVVQVFWASGGPPVTIGNGVGVLLFEFEHIGSCEEPFIIHIVDEPTPVLAAGPPGAIEALIFGAVFLVEGDCQVEVDAGEDQFVCNEGDLVTLNGTVSGEIYDFFWEPQNLVTNPFSLNSTATVPDNPTVFMLTGRSESHNIVYNTHFDFGYAGFFSDYEYDEDDISAGNAFAVANSPDIVFSNFPLCSDHTGNNGNMIIVNGTNAPPQNVWCQYIEVQEGIEYQLEAYINTLTSGFLPQAELQFSIDGDFVGAIFDPPAIPCFSGWVRMNANWIAQADGTITFCIYNHQGNVSPVGNGFIIDDIAMYPICEVEDEITVDILEPVEVFLDEKICWNGQPIEIGGQVFSETGNYIITIERPGQCDSIVHLDLEVIELEILVDNPGLINCFESTIFLDASFSSMGDHIEFIWSTTNGNIVSGQGTPIIEADAGGNYILQLLYDDGDIICPTDEVPFIVEEDRESPDVSILGENELDCNATEITLEAEVEPPGNYDYQWSTVIAGSIVGNDFEPTVTINAAGFYQLIVTNFLNGCSDTAFFEVGLSADFPEANAGGDRVWNCNDSLLILDGSQSEQGIDISYLWTTENGLIVGPAEELLLSISSVGTYVLIVTNEENSCISTDTVRVSLPDSLPFLMPEGDSLINCNIPIGTIGFSLNPDSLEAVFNWTTLDGTINSSPDSAFIQTAAAGWYVAEVFFPENGCYISDSILVLADFNFPIADAGRDTVLGCSPPSIVLDGSNSDTSSNLLIEWTGPLGGILTGANTYFPTVIQAGTYFLNISDSLNGCVGMDSVVVVPADDLPQITFQGSRVINCIDSSILIQAVVSPSNFSPVFDWETSDGNFDILGDSSSIVVYSAGIYSLNVLFEENQCSSSEILIIEEDLSFPEIEFLTFDSLYCGNELIRLDIAVDSSLDLNYAWIGPLGGIISGEETASPQIGEEGWYVVTVVNESNGCISTDSIRVNARFDEPEFEIEQQGALDCSGAIAELSLINTDGVNYSVQWNSVAGNILTDPSADFIFVDQSGWYFISATHPLSNCVRIDSVEVINNAELPVADAGPNRILNCRDSIVELDGTLSDQGMEMVFLWTTNNGNIVSGESSPNPLVNAAGIYYLTVSNTSNSCSSVDSVEVFEDIVLPGFFISGDSLINCRDSIAQLSLVPQESGEYVADWLNPSGELILSGDDFELTVNEAGEYQINLTDIGNYCSSSVWFTVDEDFRVPIAQIECLDCGVCLQLPAVLDANGSQSASGILDFSWGSSVGDWEDIGSGRLMANAEGWYYLKVADAVNGCSSRDSIWIELDQVEMPPYQLFPLDCRSAEGEIHMEESSNIISYSIDGGINWQNSSVFSGLLPGFFDLMVRDSVGCESDVLTVELEDLRASISISLPADLVVSSGGVLQLNLEILSPNPGLLNYNWEPPALFSCENCHDPEVGPIVEDQLISVQVISEGGCVGSTESWLRLVRDSAKIYIPNAFSPNDDGINDRLVVYASESVDKIHSISVFSRWGEVFFSRENFPPNDDSFGWDGTINGEKAPPGIYFAMVEVEEMDGIIKIISKSITLIR